MKTVFGPVPSRRLGQSLGVDTIPLKTCNWNCVYCQLGRSVPLVNERREYVPRKQIISEVQSALESNPPASIDWVTFVGSGEPLLHSGMGWMLRQVQQITDLPVAVITNGALLYKPDVRAEIVSAQAVLPSLDAGNPRLYRKINRPYPQLTFERLVEGLAAFRQEYTGELWVEVMLIQGLNDSPQALEEMALALQRIQPDQVHLNLPTRPPAETWVQSPDEQTMQRARAMFGEVSQVVSPKEGYLGFNQNDPLTEVILGLITRHPMQEETLVAGLSAWTAEEVQAALLQLKESSAAQPIQRFGVQFWSAAAARYSG